MSAGHTEGSYDYECYGVEVTLEHFSPFRITMAFGLVEAVDLLQLACLDRCQSF